MRIARHRLPAPPRQGLAAPPDQRARLHRPVGTV